MNSREARTRVLLSGVGLLALAFAIGRGADVRTLSPALAALALHLLLGAREWWSERERRKEPL